MHSTPDRNTTNNGTSQNCHAQSDMLIHDISSHLVSPLTLLRFAAVLELRITPPLQHSMDLLHLLLDHLCWGLVANKRA